MEQLTSILTIKNITNIFKKAIGKYKIANSSFWVISLSFYTVLSLVPLFAILFSLGSWFGVKERLIEQINTFSPLKKDVIELLLRFSNNLLINVREGVLAGLGFILLGWTFIKMFSLIENSFNDVWHVKKARTIVRKVSDYIAFFIFLPLVFIVINGLSIFLSQNLGDGYTILIILWKIIPYFSLVLFLTALYIIMPNTKVKLLPAFISGIIFAIIFFIFQYIFFKIQTTINTYSVIYGSFSIIFIFMMWIKISWIIILLGVHFCYFLQNSNFDINIDSEGTSINFNSKLYLVLKMLEEIIRRYLNKETPPTLDDLRKNINSSPFLMENILEDLKKENYIVIGENEDGENIYSVAKNIETVKLKEIYNFLANSGLKIYNLENEKIDNIEKIIMEEDYNRVLKSLGDNGVQ